ncbi:MAG: BatA domain-containing protein, partial [Cyclobacteriaceae bacterium]|nr:BatA domain-containing protein [Cyclobacteriaceae bacterium]
MAPQFLYGLFGLAIPVIIHLFNFRKARKVYFSSNRFLRKANQETNAKRRLKNLLVLCARLFFIFFLVMAFVQPYIPAKEGNLSRYVNIYLDNSLSMSNEADIESSAFSIGIDYVNNIVEQYPQGTQFRLLTSDFAPFSNIFRSKEEIVELTTELEYSRYSRTISEIATRILPEDAGIKKNSDFYWISDFQHSMSEIPDRWDTIGNGRIIPLSFTGARNIYVDSVYLENPYMFDKDKLVLLADIVNTGREEVTNLIIHVYLDDIQVTTGSLDILPENKATVRFELIANMDSIHTGRITFEDFPVTFDNDFYFTLAKAKKISILEIKGSDKVTNIQQVYGNKELFDLKSYTIDFLDFNALSSAEVIVLNGINKIEEALLTGMREHLDKFRTLVVIPGTFPDLVSYNTLIMGANISLANQEQNISIAVPDIHDPFYRNVFEEMNKNMQMPSAKPVIQWFYDREAVLKFNTGQPYISSIPRKGKVFLFASPLENEYTSLHQHALFVPVMYKMAMSAIAEDPRLYYSLDENYIQVQLDTLAINDVVKLATGEIEVIPDQKIQG